MEEEDKYLDNVETNADIRRSGDRNSVNIIPKNFDTQADLPS